MQEIRKAKIEKQLFYLMLIFSCLAYAGYYMYARRNGLSLLISYSRSSQSMMQASSLFIMAFRFGKDVCAALLLLVEMLSINKSYRAKIFLIMVVIVAYGTIVALANNLKMNIIISGYRMVMYFYVLTMFFNGRTFSLLSLKTFIRLITLLIIVNTVIAAIQAYDMLGLNLALVGQRSYRFMGLFPSAAAFAYFCFGAALFAYCIETQSNLYHIRCIIIISIAFVGCYISGTRSSMINLLIVLFFYIIENSRMRRGQKIFISFLLALPVIAIVLRFSISLANRGSILENALGGGRITIFNRYIFGQPLINLLFGNGLGAGSNTSAELTRRITDSGLMFLDGTFTVLFYQFGLIGFTLSIFLIWSIVKNIYFAHGLLNATLFGGTIVLQCLTTNVLEAFALLIMLFVCYFTQIKGNKLFRELEMEFEKS